MRLCIVAILLVVFLESMVAAQQPGAPAPQPLPTTTGKMLTFELLIAELDEPSESATAESIVELANSGKLKSVSRLQVSSLEGLPASVQFGQLQSRATGQAGLLMRGAPAPRGGGGPAQPGRGFAPGGPAVQQALQRNRDVNVGTLAQMTARLEDDGTIATQLFIERTGVAPVEAPQELGGNAAPNSVDRLSTSTIVRLKPGEPQIIGGQQIAAGNKKDKNWIVLRAHVGAIPPKPAAETK